MPNASNEGLFAEFDAVSRDEWIAAIEASLHGGTVDRLMKRTYEGIEVGPIATAEDVADVEAVDTLPGQHPYLRGQSAAGYLAKPWLIAQALDIADPLEFNNALKLALANGQSAIRLDTHPNLETVADLQTAFAKTSLCRVPVFLPGGARALRTYRLLSDGFPADSLSQLSGCIGFDPLHSLAQAGTMNGEDFDKLAAHVRRVKEGSPQLGSIAVRTDVYHDAGANAVQELAIALATSVVYMRELIDRELKADFVAGKLHFFLSIGENFFMEMAKLRAIKRLWSQVVRAFGADVAAGKINLHVRTGQRNKTQLDPHVNMLRATTEALAGAIGGVDSIMVAPFDAPLGASNDFSHRIARNLQLILQNELQLTRLIDPAGGAWHVEKLSEELARKAWKMFQEIEAAGGILEALEAGSIQAQIEAISQQRQSDAAHGQSIIVGTNKYPNLQETLSFDEISEYERVVSSSVDQVKVAPLKPLRQADPFEQLRRRADDYRRQHGNSPQILLVGFGEASVCQQQLDVARECFAFGGFRCSDCGGQETIDAALQTLLESEAKACVLCANDDDMPEAVLSFIREVKARKPELSLIVASKPEGHEALKRAGVDDFVYRGADMVALNRRLQKRLGVDE